MQETVSDADSLLSAGNIALYRGALQVYTDLLAVCLYRHQPLWRGERALSGSAADFEMPPLP